MQLQKRKIDLKNKNISHKNRYNSTYLHNYVYGRCYVCAALGNGLFHIIEIKLIYFTFRSIQIRQFDLYKNY